VLILRKAQEAYWKNCQLHAPGKAKKVLKGKITAVHGGKAQ